MVAPLIARDTVTGMMAVWRQSPGKPFTDAELAFFEGLAQQATIAIENARFYTRGPRGAGAPPRTRTRPSPRSSRP